MGLPFIFYQFHSVTNTQSENSIISASINTVGNQLTVAFDGSAVPEFGNNRVWLNTNFGHPFLNYISGSNTNTIVFNIDRPIYSGQTVSLDSEDCAISGVVDILGLSVTNNSIQTYTPAGRAITAADKSIDGIIYITSGGSYYLNEDISFDGPGIAICTNNVILDGNYHTITYNNGTPVSLTNAGFENGTTGWDFTNAPNAQIHTPANRDYGWLNNELYEGNSSLAFTDCTTGQYVETSSTVTLEANTTYVLSAMVHYSEGQQPTNPGVKPYVRLMSGSTILEGSSTIDTGPRGKFWYGVGNHSTDDTNKDYANWVSGRTYALNNYAKVSGVQYRCTTANSDSSFTTGNWTVDESSYSFVRGIQLLEMRYTTSGSPDNVNIRIGIVGHVSATENMYFDDIRVRRLRCYGITNSLATDDNTTFMSEYGTGYSTSATTGNTIKNIRVIQGQDGGAWCHGVVFAKNNSCTLSNSNIQVFGNNSSCIGSFSQTNNDRRVTINNCTLTSNIDAITSRDNGHGAMVESIRGTITGNAFWNGPAIGVALSSIGSNVSYNRFCMMYRYSNANSIIAGGGGSSITITDTGIVSYNTIISNKGGTGYRAGPGIMLTSTDATIMNNNYINVRLRGNNQEYSVDLGGDQQNGIYGFQLEAASNKTIYNNYIEVGSEYGEAHCARIGGSDVPYENNDIYNNTFRAILEPQGTGVLSSKNVASIYRITYLDASENTTIHDNTGYTNSRIIGSSSECLNQTFEGDTYHVYSPTESGATFQTMEWYYGPGLTGIKFLDPVFGTELAATEMRADVPVAENGSPHSGDDYSIQWTTTFHVQNASLANVSGATVTVNNVVPTGVFSGTSDVSGNIAATITESLHQSTGVTNYNNHSVVATSGVFVGSGTFTADAPKTITMEIV